VRRRLGVVEPHQRFDHDRVRQPDAEREATAGRDTGGDRLLRHAKRVTRIAGKHRGPELDALRLTRNHRKRGKGIHAEELRHPQR